MSCRLWCIAAVLAVVSGCASCHLPRIDPTGEHVFAPEPVTPQSPAYQTPVNAGDYHNVAGGSAEGSDAFVTLTPTDHVAQVGSEVILVAGVGGADRLLYAHRRLEWTISPGSVGQFTDIAKTDWADRLLGDNNPHQIATGTYAVGSTGHTYDRLTRGTPDPADDVYVTSGQGWVSLTSPVEGDSVVTVVAPQVPSWEARHKTAVIHWLDVNWRFPPPAINPAGTKHTFTTTVTKHTTQSPSEGWLVRYSIVSGPPAGFLPDLATSIEVPTNAAGQASAEIAQKTPANGTNQINIEVIRPGNLPGADGKKLIIGRGATMKTWTAAVLQVKNSGPAMAAVGSALTYRIDVSNPGGLPAKDVQISNPVPDGLSYVGSNPPAEAVENVLRWRLGDLGVGQRRAIEVNFRAAKEGSVVNCVDAIAAGGLKVSDCATTTVAATPAGAPGAGAAGGVGPGAAGAAAGTSPIELRISEPPPTPVGNEAKFLITITNRSAQPSERLTLYDAFDPGLQYKNVTQKNHIDADLGILAPNEPLQVPLAFKVTQAGQLFHTVKVLGAGNKVLANKKASVMGVGPGTPPTGPGGAGTGTPPARERYGQAPTGGPGAGVPPGGPGTPPAGQSPLSIKVTGPSTKLTVREIASFVIEITNTGTKTLNTLKVEATLDPVFETREGKALASQGFWHDQGRLYYVQPYLPAGQKLRLEIQSECLQASAKAIADVRVVSVEGAMAEGEASCEILAAGAPPGPAPGAAAESKLQMTVSCPTNPARVGKQFNCLVTVVNNGAEEERNVAVEVVVPDGLAIRPLGTTGPDASTKAHIEKQTVRFDPLPALPPGQPQRYSVLVQTKTAKSYTFTALLSSQKLVTPTRMEQSVDVTQ